MPYTPRTAKKDAVAGHPIATTAPYDLDRCRWLVVDGSRIPVVNLSRRRVTVELAGRRHTVRRRDLEHTGTAFDGTTCIDATTYQLPDDMEQSA